MAKVELTSYQKEVVTNEGGTLLISAAAGSGKTHVLIDRMLRKVNSETDPCNIDDFLIITFTKAAAAELRGKIIRRINAMIAEGDGSRHLQEQLSRVYLAQISTIHGFCSSLLRDYAHELDLPVDFRIVEESEAYAIRDKVMSNLLDEAYREKHEDIMATMDILGAGRDDKTLPKMIYRSYDAIMNTPNRNDTLKNLRDMLEYHYAESISESPWGKFLIGEFKVFLTEALNQVREVFEIIENNSWLSKYASAFEEMEGTFLRYESAEGWDDIRQIAPLFGKLSSINKAPDPELKDYVQEIRKTLKKKLDKWLDKFRLPSSAVIEDLCRTAPALRGLLLLTERFTENFRKEKQGRHLLDYDDLEQETLELLYRKGNTPTPIAREISQRYVELMIDEYQDTNGVQDKIFAAISHNGKNLFFVGDVKQSIYGFRRAEPQIFTAKYYSYADFTKAKEGEPRKILLSDNFRSSALILQAANDVFRLLMNKRVGDVDYGEEEALRPKGKVPPLAPGYKAVELHGIHCSKEDKGPDRTEIHYEAEFVARRIAAILKNEPLPMDKEQVPTKPEDIVILMRSPSVRAVIFQKALQRYGIQSVCSNENLFEADEIRFLYSLLQIIDNPHRDIPLLSVLLSKVVRLSPDTLAQARSKYRKADVYDALRWYSPDEPFLRTLDDLRRCGQRGCMRELFDMIEDSFSLRKVYSKTQYNLDAFASVVDQFDSGTRFGLPAFLQHIERLKDKGLQGEDTKAKGAVQITTIHKSKGLEYPIVFLCCLGVGFNLRDSYESVQIDETFGVAAKVLDKERMVTYPTVALNAIKEKLRRDTISEEMRLLYVAMTRPQHRLIMTCSRENLAEHVKGLQQQIADPMPRSVIESAGSLGDWVLMTALTYPEDTEGDRKEKGMHYPWSMRIHHASGLMEQRNEEGTIEEPVEVPALRVLNYAYEKASRQEGKLTATQLKGEEKEDKREIFSPIPRSMKPNFAARKLSATERGTAIHMAMQYMKYELCTDIETVSGELERLVSEGFITREQAEAVPPVKILRFFHSPLGHRVLKADKVIREFKFSILEDAGKYDPELTGEKYLLQGVTDCCFVEDGYLNILDFKSDRITKETEQDRAEYYRGQIYAYAEALSKIFQLPVRDKILYFFATDSAYSLT